MARHRLAEQLRRGDAGRHEVGADALPGRGGERLGGECHGEPPREALQQGVHLVAAVSQHRLTSDHAGPVPGERLDAGRPGLWLHRR